MAQGKIGLLHQKWKRRKKLLFFLSILHFPEIKEKKKAEKSRKIFPSPISLKEKKFVLKAFKNCFFSSQILRKPRTAKNFYIYIKDSQEKKS